jgi:hypothetical protein
MAHVIILKIDEWKRHFVRLSPEEFNILNTSSNHEVPAKA